MSAFFLFMLFVAPMVGSFVVGFVLHTQNIVWLKEISTVEIALLYLLISFFIAFGLVPTTIVAYASGFVWGWQSVIYMVFAYFFAQWLGYKAAKWLGVDRLLSDILQLEYYRANMLIINAIKNEFVLVFFCRLSPVLPFGIMNFVLSLMQVKLKPFLIVGLLGMLPRTLFFIWVGIESEILLSMPVSDWCEKGIWVLISAISVFIIMKILTKNLTKSIKVGE
ncbi:MAG: TVP38/TMEM64 family protein [Cytophagales bacterium]